MVDINGDGTRSKASGNEKATMEIHQHSNLTGGKYKMDCTLGQSPYLGKGKGLAKFDKANEGRNLGSNVGERDRDQIHQDLGKMRGRKQNQKSEPTKIDGRRIDQIRDKVGFKHGLNVQRLGLSGGLTLWWRRCQSRLLASPNFMLMQWLRMGMNTELLSFMEACVHKIAYYLGTC